MRLGLIILKYFDLHCDTFLKIFEEGKDLSDPTLAVNVNDLGNIKTYVQQFAVYLSGKESDPKEYYKKVLSMGVSQLKKSNISIIKTKNGLETHNQTGGAAALLAVEGGWFINSESDVENLCRDGIRTVSLCWNYDTPLAGGALQDGELTLLGMDVIRCLNRYNIALDVSHLNRKSFYKAVSIAENVVATHSGVDAIVKHPRNLADEQLKLIKDKNGVVGLCFYPLFAGSMPIDGIIRATDHALNLGLADNISFGSDFDGADMGIELSSVQDVSNLYKRMHEFFSKPIVSKIFFENSYIFYSKVLTNTEI